MNPYFILAVSRISDTNCSIYLFTKRVWMNWQTHQPKSVCGVVWRTGIDRQSLSDGDIVRIGSDSQPWPCTAKE